MVEIGDVFVLERRVAWGGDVQHKWEAPVLRVTAKRAYFDRMWFALDDPSREVKPRYLNYRTTAVPKESDA